MLLVENTLVLTNQLYELPSVKDLSEKHPAKRSLEHVLGWYYSKMGERKVKIAHELVLNEDPTRVSWSLSFDGA